MIHLNKRKKILLIPLVLLLVSGYFIPQLVIQQRYSSHIYRELDKTPGSDLIVVFGAHVTSEGELTPLLKERLEAGLELWQKGKGKQFVVSNTAEAAEVMQSYLIAKGVPGNTIILDKQAEKTTDTCVFLNQSHKDYQILFVSQGYHLPRLIFQCQKIGVMGVGFAAETTSFPERPTYSMLIKLQTRTQRYSREAFLTWLAVLGVYK